jgi:hypothetical protein
MRAWYVVEGAIGSNVNMGAVYEGTPELQKISENAIYGDATPSGELQLQGIDIGRIDQNEEYYVDLIPDFNKAASPASLFSVHVEKVFRSPPAKPGEEQYYVPQFRFNGTTTRANATLYMGVRNPAAIAMLDAENIYLLTISKAVGRRPEEEIILRVAEVEKAKALVPGKTWGGTEEQLAAYIAELEKKLARAKGF